MMDYLKKQYDILPLTWETGLHLSVLTFFFCLPLRSDNSLVVAIMGICALGAAKNSGLSLRMLTIGRAEMVLCGFLLYGCALTASSLLHPETLSDFPRLLFWTSCIVSGVMCSRILKSNNDIYIYALITGILFSIIAGSLMVLLNFDLSLWSGPRLKLLSIHPSRLALYCVSGFFFCIYKSLTDNDKRKIYLNIILAFILLALTFATNTRALILLLPAGLFFFLFIIPKNRRRQVWITILILFIFFSIALLTTDNHPATKRLRSAVTNIHKDTTFVTRIPIWLAGWDAFREAPFFGNGANSFRELHASYIAKNKEFLEREYPSYEKKAKQSHNLILGRMVDAGAIGAFGFFVFYFGGVAYALRTPINDRWIFALLLYYFLMSMVDDPLYRKNDSFLLLLAGIAIGYSFMSSKPNQSKERNMHNHFDIILQKK